MKFPLYLVLVVFGSLSLKSLAQDFTTLHTFDPYSGVVNNLIRERSTLYGAVYGGTNGGSIYGTIFSINSDGSDYTVLHSFSNGLTGACGGGLCLSGDKLYGVCSAGWQWTSQNTNTNGAIFSLNTDGTSYNLIYTFTPQTQGGGVSGNLIISGNTIFGVTGNGGNWASGLGTIFQINTDGTGFNTLHSFTGGTDGYYTLGGLCLSTNNTLYGTAYNNSNGLIFSLITSGTNAGTFKTIYQFTDDVNGGSSSVIVNGNTIYGIAESVSGFTNNMYNGYLFSLNTDGSNFQIIHTFPYGMLYDNLTPQLLLLDGTLYGVTPGAEGNRPGGYGSIFSINTDGSDFRTIYNFTNGTDGSYPNAPLLYLGGFLIGTTEQTPNGATIFKSPLNPITPINQTIGSFAPISNQVVGVPFTFTTPISSSGLPVSITIKSGSAIVTGYTITPTKAGTVVIAANQSGNTACNPAPEVTTSFTVKDFNQGIANFKTIPPKNYPCPPFAVSLPKATSGLPVTLSVISGPATVKGNTVTVTTAGIVVLGANQGGNAKYNPAPQVTTSFSVGTKTSTQKITPFKKINTKIHGASFTITLPTASSGLPVAVTVQSGNASINGNTVTLTGTGYVTLAADQGGNQYFNPAPEVTTTFFVQ
jgi:uncharacterized repeat protein (TIGR03803 family)